VDFLQLNITIKNTRIFPTVGNLRVKKGPFLPEFFQQKNAYKAHDYAV